MFCKVDTQTEPTFRLKIVTILVGILDVILASVGSCGHKNDIYFLVTILIVFSLSFLHLTCALLDVFKANCTSRGMDFLFHLIGGCLVMISSVVLLSATDPQSCRVMEKTSAATIGIFNSLIYIYICWLILNLLRKKEEGPLLPLYLFCGFSRTPVVFAAGTATTTTTDDLESSPATIRRRRSSLSIPIRLISSAKEPRRSRDQEPNTIVVKSSSASNTTPVPPVET